MTSSNCYSALYPFPFDLNEDDQHQHQHFLTLKYQPSSSSSSCQGEPQEFQDQQHQAKIYDPKDEPLESGDEGLKLSKRKKEERVESDDHHHEDSSDKWMPSKLRILRKMMSSSDHMDISKTKSEAPKVQNQPSSSPDNSSNSSYNNNNNSPVRVCADCNTTKTPLWRSGPRGPKSLCNACGIRQRKARRAMAAAVAASNGTTIADETKTSMKSKAQNKSKRSSSNYACVAKLKNKKCKLGSQSQGRKKLCFEDLRMILSKNSAFHRVFPQDEKEAAILLMALSYGLVHG